MVIFDPYSDCLARDIRNSLSSALVKELTGDDSGFLSAVADDWLAMAPAPIYQTYIQDRLALYRRDIDEIRASQDSDTRDKAIYVKAVAAWALFPISTSSSRL